MNPRRPTVVILLGIFAESCVCGTIAAQEPEIPPATLPQVIVTATNYSRQEFLQDTPAAVSTISGAHLENGTRFSILDLPRTVPNFAQSHAGLRSFSDNYVVRGLGNTEFLSDPAVVLYVDDAPFGSALTYSMDLLAIDRVDVYRGPQGSRFGKNAEAGVISVVTRQPGNRLEAEAGASVASFDTKEYRALAQGPLVKDKLYFSLAGQYSVSEGFIRNTFLHSHADEREGINSRGFLLWTPVENWKVDFTAAADDFHDGVGLVPLSGSPRQIRSEFDGEVAEFVNSQVLRVQGTLPALGVTSITARRDFRLDPLKFDPDFSPLTGNTGIVRYADVQWSEELRVKPTLPGDRWDWHAGFFFSTTGTRTERPTDFFVPPLALSGHNDIDSTARSDTYALFGEYTRTIDEKLDVTLGLRLDYTAREMDRTRNSTLFTPPPVHAAGDFFNAAPKLTLGYHLTDDLLLYGSTGLGFKPGGYSPYLDPPASPKFDTETAWASEIGLKSTWLNGKLRANVALFYSDVTDYQVEQFAPIGFDFTVANAPKARTMGGELELTASPATGWEFSGFFGYTDARLERFTDPFTGVTVRDKRPPFVAEFNGGVWAQYKHWSGLFGRVVYSAFGDKFYDVANTAAFQQSACGLLSARLGFERQHYGLYLFGENLTDTEYFQKKIPPLNAGAPGRPRTFGVMVMARY